MALKIVKNDNLFRIEGQEICISWVSDTPENRKAMLRKYFFSQKKLLTFHYFNGKIKTRHGK